MATINRLPARAPQTLTKPGRHADGGGLYLFISSGNRKRWIFMYNWQGRRKEMGLGPAGAGGVSLAKAREGAANARAAVAAGFNPLAAKNASRAARSAAPVPTFGEFAEQYIKTHESAWRNDKSRTAWRTTLIVDAQTIGNMPVDEVDRDAVMSVLAPIWLTKNETAKRLRGRIEKVLDAAKVTGLRDGENPARWRGYLQMLLPKEQMLARKHHAALPFEQLPKFITELRKDMSLASHALEFIIINAARRGEVLGACWGEIEETRQIWTVPAARMKAGVEHRVPLTDRAREILSEMDRFRHPENPFIFPGKNSGKPLSGTAIQKLMARLGHANFTIHGFRSTFRDWAGETTGFPTDVCESALAHARRDKVVAAYRRGTSFAKRRNLMDAWASFATGDDGKDNVVPMRG